MNYNFFDTLDMPELPLLSNGTVWTYNDDTYFEPPSFDLDDIF